MPICLNRNLTTIGSFCGTKIHHHIQDRCTKGQLDQMVPDSFTSCIVDAIIWWWGSHLSPSPQKSLGHMWAAGINSFYQMRKRCTCQDVSVSSAPPVQCPHLIEQHLEVPSFFLICWMKGTGTLSHQELAFVFPPPWSRQHTWLAGTLQRLISRPPCLIGEHFQLKRFFDGLKLRLLKGVVTS